MLQTFPDVNAGDFSGGIGKVVLSTEDSYISSSGKFIPVWHFYMYPKRGVEVVTGWNTEEGELPVFKNTLKEGKLSVSKYVVNPDGADPNQEFTFKVVLIGEDVNPEEITEYELREAPARENPVIDDTDSGSTGP